MSEGRGLEIGAIKSPEAPATVWPIDNGLRIEFDEPQRAITPGQAVVFYDGDVVVGGAWIERVESTVAALTGSEH